MKYNTLLRTIMAVIVIGIVPLTAIEEFSDNIIVKKGVLILQLVLVVVVVFGLNELYNRSNNSAFRHAKFVQPSIGKLVFRGKYEIPYSKANAVKEDLLFSMNPGFGGYLVWTVIAAGNTVTMRRSLTNDMQEEVQLAKNDKKYFEKLGKLKGSVVKEIDIVLIPEGDIMIAEIIAKSLMYFQVTQIQEITQLKQDVDDVEIELSDQMRKIAVGVLKGIELQAPGPSDKRPEDLIEERFVSDLPKEVSSCLREANMCYTHNLMAACSVMIRKGLENAIRIKFHQMSKSDLLYGSDNQELGFKEILNLSEDNIPEVRRDVNAIRNTVKWFGDKGAHDPRTAITAGDLKDNVAPKAKSFLNNLHLKY